MNKEEPLEDPQPEQEQPKKKRSKKGKKKKIYIVEESSSSDEEPDNSINVKIQDIKNLLKNQKYNH